MGILSKDIGLYDGEENKEISCTDTGINIGTGNKLKSSILSSGLGMAPWNTGDLTVSVCDSDGNYNDIDADSISAWPTAYRYRNINSSVAVPLPRCGIKDDMDKAMEYARRYIANAIAEQMIASGAIQFTEHKDFGDERLVVEGNVSVQY